MDEQQKQKMRDEIERWRKDPNYIPILPNDVPMSELLPEVGKEVKKHG